ncbi:MAG TPA: metallophosphoesterase [bacterium]|uniref:Calcineurin-like phosphoesterase n=1 Tax=candidate division TA06 bacterium ADurb.Bin417 TaxID=1852828 RepID=A0A1V5MIR8_UNCT6|nr:MAG: Calcineurin-like phosphoesterase [candidate division TA06 bacterium ADurb.Bin417]HNQ35024.1 metallophosphoesterase [bacterium]HNS49041.1 metallophosphoesterase [bacterium]
MFGRLRRPAGFLLLAVLLWCRPLAAEEPLFRFCQISSPTIAAAPADLAGDRSHYGRNVEMLKQRVGVVNGLKPAFLLVDGTVTAVGSAADYRLLAGILGEVKAPVYLGKGDDRGRAGRIPDPARVAPPADFEKEKIFDYRPFFSTDLKGIHLAFIMEGYGTPAAAEFLESDLAAAEKRGARGLIVLLNTTEVYSFVAWWQSRGKVPVFPDEKLAALFKKYQVSLVVLPGVPGQTQFPFLRAGDTYYVSGQGLAIDTRFYPSQGLIYEVYPDRTLVRTIPLDGQPSLELTAWNGRAPGGRAARDRYLDNPYGCESYAEDLAAKPLLTFVQISDTQHSPKRWDSYRRRVDVLAYEAAVEDINRLRPAFVINSGDLVDYSTPEAYAEYQRVSNLLAVPLYETPGNHDRYLPEGQAWPEGTTLEAKLAQYLKHTRPNGLDYAFEKNGVRFISVNSTEDRVNDLEFLKKALEESGKSRYLFVYTHFPFSEVFGNGVANADEAAPLLAKYQPTALLGGHRHRFAWRVIDGIPNFLADGIAWGSGMARADLVGGRVISVYHLYPDRLVVGMKPLYSSIYARITVPVKARR